MRGRNYCSSSRGDVQRSQQGQCFLCRVDYVLRALYPEMLVLPQLSRRTPKITVGVVSAIMSPLR